MSLLSSGYHRLFRLKLQGSEADNSYQYRSKLVEVFFHAPTRLHGMMINHLSKGTTLAFTQNSSLINVKTLRWKCCGLNMVYDLSNLI
jgi:hypothetical protein